MNKTHHDSGNHPAARRPRGVATNPRALLARNDHPLPRGVASQARALPARYPRGIRAERPSASARHSRHCAVDALVRNYQRCLSEIDGRLAPHRTART